jgi:hypothetical protein
MWKMNQSPLKLDIQISLVFKGDGKNSCSDNSGSPFFINNQIVVIKVVSHRELNCGAVKGYSNSLQKGLLLPRLDLRLN